jgi:hypothetical protein
LEKHIFNFDKEIFYDSGLSAAELMNQPEAVMANPVIQEWAKTELNLSRQLAVKINRKTLDLRTRGLVTFLTAPILFSRNT